MQIVEVETPNIETKLQQGPAPPQQPESLEHAPRTGTPSPVVATPPPPAPSPTFTRPEEAVVPSSEADTAFIAIQGTWKTVKFLVLLIFKHLVYEYKNIAYKHYALWKSWRDLLTIRQRNHDAMTGLEFEKLYMCKSLTWFTLSTMGR